MSDISHPTITGYLNYDEETDEYWHGVLGWVPKYVEELKKLIDPIGEKDGVLYRYLYHTGDWGEEVRVYFKKISEEMKK